MAIQPSDEVLERFGVRLLTPLGGRLNQHWLVEARRERLVLRRWWQPVNEIDYELRLLARIAALGWPVAPAIAARGTAGALYSASVGSRQRTSMMEISSSGGLYSRCP